MPEATKWGFLDGDQLCVSIHTSHAGGDIVAVGVFVGIRFQSTPPVWEATQIPEGPIGRIFVSIHASRVGGDHPGAKPARPVHSFNPRLPCGRRQSARQQW